MGLVGCGPSIPARYVVERDIGGYAFRRYQKTLDVEFPMQGNASVGHTATYVVRDAEGIELATAFVTVYKKAPSLAATVRAQLRSLGTYDLSVVRLHREYVWRLDGDDAPWLIWVSGNRVVKLSGPPSQDMPDDLVARYLDVYESDLDEHGRAEEDAPSAGEAQLEEEADMPTPQMPSSLEQGE